MAEHASQQGRGGQAQRTVIFLGGGASAADGAPLQGEIFRQRLALAEEGDLEDEVRRFFEEFFGIRQITDGVQLPTFEEVLGILEIAEQEDESFRGWGTDLAVPGPRRAAIQTLHDRMVFLIARTLHEALRGHADVHTQLLANLKRRHCLASTSFISLNYDILVDNAILDLYPDWDIDYCVPFSNVQMPGGGLPNDEWHEPRPDRAIRLLKLHGSLNWLYCPTCRSLGLTPKQKGVCRLETDPEQCRCPQCGTVAVPIVIPPTYFKVLSNLYLRRIWHEAEQDLLQANRIIFCGYSFPEADIHVRYLLKRAEMNRTGPGPEVIIVNEHDRKSESQRDQEQARYRRFFRDKSKFYWTDLSFQAFAADPDQIDVRGEVTS